MSTLCPLLSPLSWLPGYLLESIAHARSRQARADCTVYDASSSRTGPPNRDRIGMPWRQAVRVETMDRVRAWSTRAVSLLSSDVIVWTIMLGGVALRVRQVAAHLSLGNDEAALLRSIAHASWAGLARPFLNHQSAPILFLIIQKTFITVLGNWDTVSEI